MPPIHTVDRVDLPRFMGDWYVIAHIPAFIERAAYNAIESYALAEDGTIRTRYRFRKGGFDGPLREYRPRGFVRDRSSNAVWGMQFLWPIKAEYRIIYLTEDYGQTVIGRSKRDHVWVMARRPEMGAGDYARIRAFLVGQGYDVSRLRRVPHRYDRAD
jgi:apolipoprotein D and lipocalin family protein